MILWREGVNNEVKVENREERGNRVFKNSKVKKLRFFERKGVLCSFRDWRERGREDEGKIRGRKDRKLGDFIFVV